MRINVYKQSGKLIPCTSDDKLKVDKMPVGEPMQIRYVQIRNPKHHRLYFSFISAVYENLPEKFDNYWPDKNSFRKAMEMYSGYFVETVSLKGDRHLQPKSIAYDKLDETAFSELHGKVKNTIGKRILPEMDMDVVEQAIEHFY